jgi:hypothetical protein
LHYAGNGYLADIWKLQRQLPLFPFWERLY